MTKRVKSEWGVEHVALAAVGYFVIAPIIMILGWLIWRGFS